MSAIDIIMTATATGFGVALGNLLFEQIKTKWKIHKERAMKIGEKIGSGINKRFINKECV